MSLLLSLFSGFFLQTAEAQTPTPTPQPPAPIQAEESPIWSAATNLSRSGAASQPRIFASQDGRLQAFWIDRFDGLMTALSDETVWSLPAQSMRQPSVFVAKPVKISVMPWLIAGPGDKLHAFWYGDKDPNTEEAPLLYDQMPIGIALWPPSQRAAESALVFNAVPLTSGDLQLAYVRVLKTETIPAGVYTRRTSEGGKSWDLGTVVDTSIYYRVLAPEEAIMQIAAADGAVFLAWLEPRLDQVLYGVSVDNGATWLPPAPFGPPGVTVKEPLLTVMPSGKVLRIWQDAEQSGCAIFQQELSLSTSQQASASPSVTPEAGTPAVNPTVTPAPIVLGEWSSPQQILIGTDSCPASSRFFIRGDQIYWLWGENSNSLHLTAWDEERAEWSLPQSYSFTFEDPATGRPVQLDNLHAAMSGDKLAVIGADPGSGEVWATISLISALDLAFAPPPPWSNPQALSAPQASAGQASTAIDSQGRIHIVWMQSEGRAAPSLYYAYSDGKTVSPAAEIFRSSAGEVIRQPSLWADTEGHLHLTWSGGLNGEIFYSRAQLMQASNARDWLPPKLISAAGSAAWPQLTQDRSGRLFILYIVPLNEKRGVYLTTSDKDGESWSEPSVVFDAAEAGWEMVDHPTLATAQDGSLHVAWVRTTLAAESSQGLFYTRTQGQFDNQDTTSSESSNPINTQWITPLEIAPAGGDWPRLAVVNNQLHLVYSINRTANHRWLELTEQTPEGAGWGSSTLLPGWQETQPALSSQAVHFPPFAFASDAASLHVISALPDSTGLRYNTWNSNGPGSMGRWSSPEVYTPAGRWRNLANAAATVPLTGNTLAFAWLALPDTTNQATPQPSLPGLYLSVRGVPAAQPPEATIIIPTSVPSPSPIAEPTSNPTPTLSIDMSPAPSRTPIPPLVLGGGLAAIIVLAIFIGILLQGRAR